MGKIVKENIKEVKRGEKKMSGILEKFDVSSSKDSYVRVISKLIDLRNEKGVSDVQLSRALKLKDDEINKIETFQSKPTMELCIEIAEVLGGEITILQK